MKQVITSEKLPIKMWLDNIEYEALAQARNLANLPFAFKHIALMPDAHVGYGMPIGGVLATEQVIVPNCVGVDIGCGMIAVKTVLTEIDREQLILWMQGIRKSIPLGFNHQKEKQEWKGFNEAPDIEIIQKELEDAHYQIGTLGGGNHFIEVQKGDDGHIWLMIHSGSRNIGLKTAGEYHKKAVEICDKWRSDVPTKDLSFLPMDVELGREYFKAMNFCLDFAQANRDLMMKNALEALELVSGFAVRSDTNQFELERINIHHNYAALENHFGKNVLVHRKGATKAYEGLAGIIPGSMGTNSYIVEGLGNPESFKSCSHGAGRRMGRAQAKEQLNLAEEQAKMKDVIGKPRSVSDLDEAPGAYKDIEEVINNETDLVKVKVKLTPLAVIKG